MDLVAQRKMDDAPIVAAHLRKILKKHGEKIMQETGQKIPNFSNRSYGERSVHSDDNSLQYRHKGILRFVDMKRLTYPGSPKKYERKKIYQNFNRIIMGHYTGIIGDAMYTLTEEVRAQLKSELDGKTF